MIAVLAIDQAPDEPLFSTWNIPRQLPRRVQP